VASLMRMANNLERIGDNIENIAELIEELFEQDLHLAEGGFKDYETISTEAQRFLEFVVKAIGMEDKDIMPQAEEMEDNINRMREDMRSNYIMRLQSGTCTVDPGMIFVDMLTAFEKIGDCTYNIAQAVAGVK
ncbi:MAG: Na/Pi cotransporter family protein, partial [Deltaproteobacteria bacterium]|nr:Na/Pi cotransporter family protein [Deltaproteobacteria bacterium]